MNNHSYPFDNYPEKASDWGEAVLSYKASQFNIKQLSVALHDCLKAFSFKDSYVNEERIEAWKQILAKYGKVNNE